MLTDEVVQAIRSGDPEEMRVALEQLSAAELALVAEAIRRVLRSPSEQPPQLPGASQPQSSA